MRYKERIFSRVNFSLITYWKFSNFHFAPWCVDSLPRDPGANKNNENNINTFGI